MCNAANRYYLCCAAARGFILLNVAMETAHQAEDGVSRGGREGAAPSREVRG